MKSKIIAALLTATFASVVSAQVLYWQVNPSSVTISGDTSTAGTKWNYASFWAVKDGDTASLVNSYMFNATEAPTEVKYVDTDYLSGSAPAYVNYTASDYTGYSFYIELTNKTSDGTVGVARSESFTSDNFGNALQDAANFNANWSSINAIGSGLTFTAIPEPTSGLMLLVGAAILGLRRKRQQI